MATKDSRHSVLGLAGIIALSMTAPVALGDDPGDASATPPPEPLLFRMNSCEEPPADPFAGEAASSAERLEPAAPLSVVDAVQALGFSLPEELFARMSSAREAQAEAATYVLWTPVEGEA